MHLHVARLSSMDKLGFGKLLGTGIHIGPLFYTTLDGHTDENLYQSSTSISDSLCIGIHRFIDML